MDIIALLNDKSMKALEKRGKIADAISAKLVTIQDIRSAEGLDDKKMALVLEAMEAVTGKKPEIADTEWLNLAQSYINSTSNSVKREASRVVGNIAHLFPDKLETSVRLLMENTKDDGTEVRWSSAYALARIVQIPRYAKGDLYDALIDLSEKEDENGVKNQYQGGLKKAKRLRG